MKRRSLVASMAGALLPLFAHAKRSKPFLTLSGHLGKFNHPDARTYEFSESGFLALPSSSITTATSWTPRSVFVGPKLLDVMQVAAVTSGTLTFKTLDDYSAPIPWGDLVRYGVILAHSQNGQRLSNRRWGPLWTIYPRDQNPATLKGPIAQSRFIWQVNRIEVAG